MPWTLARPLQYPEATTGHAGGGSSAKGVMMDTNKGMYDVYHIREWEDEKEGKKSFWTSIGVGFKNKDDSINIRLNLLPFDGKVQLRERNGNNNNKKPKGEQ